MKALLAVVLCLGAFSSVHAENKAPAHPDDRIRLFAHTAPTIQLPWAKGATHGPFEFEPDISFLFFGSASVRPNLPTGTDENGELVSLAPFRVVLESANGTQIRSSTTVRDPGDFVPIELRPFQYFRVKMKVPPLGVFKIEEAGRYRLQAECKLQNPDGTEFTLRAEEFWISFEETPPSPSGSSATGAKAPTGGAPSP